jgi:hypothetical protein
MTNAMFTGVYEHIRSDNGAKMTAKVVRNWLGRGGRFLHQRVNNLDSFYVIVCPDLCR